MSERVSDFLQRYALGLAREKKGPMPGARPAAALLRRARRLHHRGAKGWPERLTLHTRGLPPGCRACLRGRGTNAVITGLCSRDCFFCFNPRPRQDEMSVHGLKVSSPKEAVAIVKSRGIRSVGISGGEPLMFPRRVLGLLRALRKAFGKSLRIDLYSNGDLFTLPLLRRLKAAGLDALRVNLAANGYDLAPLRLARKVFEEVEVEIPVIPADKEKLRGLLDGLDAVGVRHLIVHELFRMSENSERMDERGCRGEVSGGGDKLLWRPTAGSAEEALGLIDSALGRRLRLSVYFCSCSTQQWIAERALRRRG